MRWCLLVVVKAGDGDGAGIIDIGSVEVKPNCCYLLIETEPWRRRPNKEEKVEEAE